MWSNSRSIWALTLCEESYHNCCIFFLLHLDGDGNTLNLALIQYLFTKGEHDVTSAPHGNAKGGEGYVRTMPSTIMKLKTAAQDKTAKRTLSFVSQGEGGIECWSTASWSPAST